MKRKYSVRFLSRLLLGSGLFFTSCSKDTPGVPHLPETHIGNQTIRHYIGERFGGGIVFYLKGTEHGLIADTVDLMQAPWWNGKFKATGATETGIGSGRSNTIQAMSASFAAVACYDSRRGGKSDWFLPSKDELNALFEQRHVIGISSFAPYSYWSSSEIDSSQAWRQTFSTGYQYTAGKNAPLRIRAIRAF